MAAVSQDAQHKSRLIRAMARDLNTTSHSCASSTGSHHGTVSEDSFLTEFDPENEAHMSTRQFDVDLSNRLPQLRDTAKKFARWNGGQGEPFVINTSAVGRAFPDFSQGGADDSTSIEIGRGFKSKRRPAGSVVYHEYSGNIDSPIMDLGEFSIRRTPPSKTAGKKLAVSLEDVQGATKPNSCNTRTRTRSVLKENVLPSQTSKAYKSAVNHTSLKKGALAVEAEYRTTGEHVQIAGDPATVEKPSSMISQVKTSRFNASPSVSMPPRRQEITENREGGLNSRALAHGQQEYQSPSRDLHQEQTCTDVIGLRSGDATQQSFLIPNIPDISELVSGTFKNGTPVFSRTTRLGPRPASQTASTQSNRLNPARGGNVLPIPDEEKNLYLSLELLQQRVAILEMEKAEYKQELEVLRRQNYELDAEASGLRKLRSVDSALGDSGSDAEYARGHQQLTVDRKKLQSQIVLLQDRLNANSKIIATQDLRLKDNTVERDAAVAQLAQAWRTSEQLNTENDDLRQESIQLKLQLDLLTAQTEASSLKWQCKEAELYEKIQRQQHALKQMQEVTKELTLHANRAGNKTEQSDLGRKNKVKDDPSQHPSKTTLAVTLDAASRPEYSHTERSATPMAPTNEVAGSQNNNCYSQHAAVDLQTTSDFHVSPGSGDAQVLAKERAEPSRSEDNYSYAFQADLAPHSNFSSILGHGEMAAMRQALAELRKMNLKDVDVLSEEPNQFGNHATGCSATPERQAKSDTCALDREKPRLRVTSEDQLYGIMKDDVPLNHKSSNNQSSMDLHCTRSPIVHSLKQKNKPHQRRRSENDGLKVVTEDVSELCASREDLAFMPSLPDLTSCEKRAASVQYVLSDGARNVLDRLVNHDCENCSVCSRVTSFRQPRSGTNSINPKGSAVHTPRPIPVSDRAIEAAPHEDEPTLRPLTKPSLALAMVIKVVQDEFAHMKMQLQRHQDTYNAHDASLGLRKRKLLKSKIEQVLGMIDDKADQLYALYDVLEGQKQNGELLEEDLMNATPQDGLVDRGAPKSEKIDESEVEEDSEPDLPWEGIDSHESTTTKGYKFSTGDAA